MPAYNEITLVKVNLDVVSADFMNNSGVLDYSRVEVAAGARRRAMKLWLSTANGPQQSRHRCEEQSDSGNLILVRMNMRSPRFARDDNFS